MHKSEIMLIVRRFLRNHNVRIYQYISRWRIWSQPSLPVTIRINRRVTGTGGFSYEVFETVNNVLSASLWAMCNISAEWCLWAQHGWLIFITRHCHCMPFLAIRKRFHYTTYSLLYRELLIMESISWNWGDLWLFYHFQTFQDSLDRKANYCLVLNQLVYPPSSNSNVDAAYSSQIFLGDTIKDILDLERNRFLPLYHIFLSHPYS